MPETYTIDLAHYARVGAEARLAAIEEEQAALLAAFPDLAPARPPLSGEELGRILDAPEPPPEEMEARAAFWTEARRKAHARSMRKAWAKRRAAGTTSRLYKQAAAK